MQNVRGKVIKMLFVVMVVFVVSWLPLQTFSLIMYLNPNIRQGVEYRSMKYNILVTTYFAFHWLSMAHSCLNPMIYCFMNDKFRTDLKDLICKRHQTYSSSSYGSHLQPPTTGGSLIGLSQSHQQLLRSSPSGGGGGGGQALHYHSTTTTNGRPARVQLIDGAFLSRTGGAGIGWPAALNGGKHARQTGSLTIIRNAAQDNHHHFDNPSLRSQSVCLYEIPSIKTGSDPVQRAARCQNQSQSQVSVAKQRMLMQQQSNSNEFNALVQSLSINEEDEEQEEDRVAVAPLGAMTDKCGIANV